MRTNEHSIHVTGLSIQALETFFFFFLLEQIFEHSVFVADRYPLNHAHYSLLLLLRTLLPSKQKTHREHIVTHSMLITAFLLSFRGTAPCLFETTQRYSIAHFNFASSPLQTQTNSHNFLSFRLSAFVVQNATRISR